MKLLALLPLAISLRLVQAAPPAQAYKWNSVKIGGGGGFVPGKMNTIHRDR